MGHSRPLFIYFLSFSNKHYNFYNNIMWKMSIQYLVLGFELTNSWTQVSSDNQGSRPKVSFRSTVSQVTLMIVWWSEKDRKNENETGPPMEQRSRRYIKKSKWCQSVWPDIGMKSSPIVPNFAQKVVTAVLYLKGVMFFQIAQKFTEYLGYFCKKICWWDLSK